VPVREAGPLRAEGGGAGLHHALVLDGADVASSVRQMSDLDIRR
jgi:hypothetical protein